MDKSNTENQMQPNATFEIQSIKDYDVLLGRGKLYENHLGNQNFKNLVNENVDRYFQVLSSDEKFDISKEIVDSIIQYWGGRFLKRGIRSWVPIDASDARKKVAQALQYQRRKVTKQDDWNMHFQNRDNFIAGCVTASNFDATPPPPELCRHDPFTPNAFKFRGSTTAMELKSNTDRKSPVDLVRSCVVAQIQSEADKKKSSLYNSSIVQASVKANIATCGKPTDSTKFNSLRQLIAQSHPKMQHQQEMESSHPSLISCSMTSSIMDSLGESTLTDTKITLTNESYEQSDDSFWNVELL